MPQIKGHFLWRVMAKFSLFVQSAVVGTPVLQELIAFADSALTQGHLIDHIFLYQDAVLAVQSTIELPTDETNYGPMLCQFAHNHQLPLLFCTTSAERRGVTSVIQPAIGAGLAEFAMRISAVDRVMSF